MKIINPLRLAIAAVTVIATAGIAFVIAPSANAASGSCPANMYCLWTHPNFTGERVVLKASVPHLAQVRRSPVGSRLSTWNEVASSAVNNTGRPIALYDGAYYRGATFVMRKGAKAAKLPLHIDNRASSVRRF